MDASDSARTTDLKRTSVIAVVLLSILSGGFYMSVWFLRRRRGLNSLDSPVKIGVVGPTALLLLQGTFFLLQGAVTDIEEQGQVVSPILGFFGLAVSVALLAVFFLLAFKVRDILMDHLRKLMSTVIGGAILSDPVQFSVLLTFLFNIWYLQFKINECIDQRHAWVAARGNVS